MSLRSQLKLLSTPIDSSYSIDCVHRKSIVYKKPEVVDGLTCFQQCLKSFEKLCSIDSELHQFKKTLFSPTTVNLEMCNLLPIHKTKIDEQIELFLFLLTSHVRLNEASWSLEWLIYKFKINQNYVENFLMFLLPYYETGLFVKCIQTLDFRYSASKWHWLQVFAERGLPITRNEFLKSCKTHPNLVPFIGSLLSTYSKIESTLATNRMQTVSSFFVSVIVGLCDANLPDSRLAKIVTQLQGVIRLGLRASNIPSFQSAASLAVARLSLKLHLNPELVKNWIKCLLKKFRPGTEWESLRLINILIRTQKLDPLPDTLYDLYQGLLNNLSPLERTLFEAEEEKSTESINLNQMAVNGLQMSERVKKATFIFDSNPSEENMPETIERITMRPDTKSIRNISYSDIFSDDAILIDKLNTIHYLLFYDSNSKVPKAFHRLGEPLPIELPSEDNWLSIFVERTILNFLNVEASETSPLNMIKDKSTVEILRLALEVAENCSESPKNESENQSTSHFSKKDRFCFITRALDEALPLICAALLHPIGPIRVDINNILERYVDLFKKSHIISTLKCDNIIYFLSNLNGIKDFGSYAELLLGDSLAAHTRTLPSFVRAVFLLLCRQPLNVNSSASSLIWLGAVRMLHRDLLADLFQLDSRGCSEKFDLPEPAVANTGWPALLHILSNPELGRLHKTCLKHMETFTMLNFTNIPSNVPPPPGTPGKGYFLASGLKLRDKELIDTILKLAGNSNTAEKEIQNLFSKLLLTVDHYLYCLAKLDVINLRDSSKSLFSRVCAARARKKISNAIDEGGKFELERSRLRALSIIISVLANDIPRLHAELLPTPMEATRSCTKLDSPSESPCSTPLTSAISRLRTSSRRKSVKSRDNDSFTGTAATKNNPLPNRLQCDLVFPLNNHLISFVAHENHLSLKSPRDTDSISTSSSSDVDCEESNLGSSILHIDDINHLDVETDTSKQTVEKEVSTGPSHFRDQNEICALETLICLTSLFKEGNKSSKSSLNASRRRISDESNSPLISFESVPVVVDTIFNCLSIYKNSSSIQRQGILCLIEMASLFPVILCHNLLKLVQLVGASSQFMRLDDSHNLSLLGRLISVAVPSLIRASKLRSDSALKVLSIFIKGLPDLPTHLPRRCLAVYVGLLRGLSHVCSPITISDLETGVTSPSPRTIKKQVSLQTWLWTASLIFLSTDWPTQETADLVFPLLLDLFNQFDVKTQLSALNQCLILFIQLVQPTEINSKTLLKRPRMELNFRDQSTTTPLSGNALTARNEHQPEDYGLLLKYVFDSTVFENDQTPFKRKRRLSGSTDDVRFRFTRNNQLWKVFSEVCALFSSLLESAGHEKRRNDFADQPNLEGIYEELVQNVVQLLVFSAVNCESQTGEISHQESTRSSIKQSVYHLQSILVKLNNFVSSRSFLDSVSTLLSRNNSSLSRKALELLLAKLNTMTCKAASVEALLVRNTDKIRVRKSPKFRKLDETLEIGLIGLVNTLSETFITDESSSMQLVLQDKTRTKMLHLSLSCFRELTKLLCNGYPAEICKLLDKLTAIPYCWWPLASEKNLTPRLASNAAETRSLICLFYMECIARLPAPLITFGSESVHANHRAHNLLRFAIDHASTACRIHENPEFLDGTGDASHTSGKMNSRDQHLQAGLTLMLGVLEFCSQNYSRQHKASILNNLRDASGDHLDLQFLSFVFKITHLDLMSATQVKLDQNGLPLKQCTALTRRIRRLLVSSNDSLGLLSSIKEILCKKSSESDMNLVSGGLDFLTQHADFARGSSSSPTVDLDESNLNTLENLYVSNPSLLWKILQFSLDRLSYSSSDNLCVDRSMNLLRTWSSSASSSLLCCISGDCRNQLLLESLRWTVSSQTSVKKNNNLQITLLLSRLQAVFIVLEKLSKIVSPESFSSSIKTASLINLLVAVLFLLSGRNKSKIVRKMVSPLELPHFLESFAALDYSKVEHQNVAKNCLIAALACLTAWLKAEAKLSACLDMAGTEAILALPTALASSLEVGLGDSITKETPLISEIDLVPAVDAFLRASGGDEALLRPFGSALCAHAIGSTSSVPSHWRTRLAALRLLKQTFDTLVEPHEQVNSSDLGVASCLLTDTLAALSEALEDERPEVEAAANRLFSDLEAAGVTTASE